MTTTAPNVAFVALGSNMGDRSRNLADARARLAELDGVTVVGESSIEETDAIGPVQPSYLNQMIAIATTLRPADLLTALHAIERAGGRVRVERWGPRTIDLDIVKYDGATWTSADLIIPHPELPNREFWRRQLGELEQELNSVPK